MTHANTTYQFALGERFIGTAHPPLVVAELSGNHNQSYERATALIEAAAQAGVDAIKLQTFHADTMTIDVSDGAFRIDDPASLWHGKTLYELYREASTPWEWHEPLIKRARDLGLMCFSTPFDETAVSFLEDLDMPCYKIASFENTDLPLIRRVVETGKPIILSSGMATAAELDEAVRTVREAGGRDLLILKCTSTYPASPQDSNLRTLPHLSELYQCPVGVSDHTLGIGVSVASIALGATLIEKHFTLARADGGVDAGFSLEPPEMAWLVSETMHAWQALGEVRYGPTGKESNSRVFRRSIYVTRDVEAGEVLTPENLRVIRPGLGLEPKYYERVLGMRVTRKARRGQPLKWDLLK